MQYTPRKKKVRNYKSEEGGYYTTKCAICHTEYFPKSSKAMYCSTNCQQTAYHKRRKVKIASAKAEAFKAEYDRQIAEKARIEAETVRLKDEENQKQIEEKRLKDLEIVKENLKTPKAPITTPKQIVNSAKKACEVIGKRYNTHRNTGRITFSLKALKVNETATFGDVTVKKISLMKYEIC
jgi:CxxC motif-containing protein